jgi:glucosylceramidase
MKKICKFMDVCLTIFLMIILTTSNSCNSQEEKYTVKKNNLDSTFEIFLTSEEGDKIAQKENVLFKSGTPSGNVIRVHPDSVKQTIDGIGSSFTESSAFVLAHLEKDKRLEVMEQIFGEDGANFSLTRTHIGACDFSVKGKYSYADKKDDFGLESFSLSPDKKGFSMSEYPGIQDSDYDLLPMIKEAITIKNNQKDKELRIISSAWTAPWWMKDIEEWYIPGSPENNWQGTGGSLKEQFIPIYADYIIKYLDAYKGEGVNIWGITPVNEPHGNNGSWESMHFSPESQNEFVKMHLGPKLKASKHAGTRILVYDQNRGGLEEWADVILGDPQTAPFVYGVAVHWYESTFKVYEDALERVHKKFPDFAIMHTEGCIDDLGKPAPEGVSDPDRFQESDWFENDAFWWNDNATDWAYTVPWQGVNVTDHPIYTPVHRYARNIIVSLDHWMTGWIDWNVVLDHNGGPNHVGNFCGAPIMINTETKKVYYTPIYYILAQFSQTIRPGDKAVQTHKKLVDLDDDALHTCATINSSNLLSIQLLNTAKSPITYQLQIDEQYAQITISANAVQTVRVQL